jgi:hypothetical protein
MTSRGRELGFEYSSLVVASGSDGLPGSNSLTDFKINLGPTLQKICRISICSATFPNQAYNINATGGGANNMFAIGFTTTSNVADFEVLPGFYTTTSLMAAVQTAVQAYLATFGLGETFTLAQDPISQKVVATFTEGAEAGNMILEDATDINGVVSTGIWEQLGFAPSVTLPTGVPVFATNLPSLGGLKEAILQSNVISPGNLIDVNGTQVNGLLCIPINVVFGVSQVFECKVDSLCEISYNPPRQMQEVDFKLTDKRGNAVNLNGGNLTINLKVWFNKF